MSRAIVVDDLQFAWPDGEVVFEGLSFVVGPGRTGLIGANGSGKSTLLRLIAGSCPHRWVGPGRGQPRLPASGPDPGRASHDLPFLRTIEITRWLRLAGRLIRIDPP